MEFMRGIPRQLLKDIFDRTDRDKDGKITFEEYANADNDLFLLLSETNIFGDLLQRRDLDGNGYITFDELEKALLKAGFKIIR